MQKIYFYFFVLSLFFSSCNYGIYTPTSPEIAPVSEKGEINGSFKFNNSRTSETQASITYSPISNFAVSVNSVFGAFHNSKDVAIGFYTNKKVAEKKFSFVDFYVGGGRHFQKSNIEYYKPDFFGTEKISISSNYNKFFGRFGYNYSKERFGFNIAAQYNFIDYGKITRLAESKELEPFVKTISSLNYLKTFEISPSFSFGPKHARLVIGNTILFASNAGDSVDRLITHAGFRFNLNYVFSKAFIDEFKKK